jgi:uncharacterized protein YjbI with pentapeptide repeats
VDLTCATVSGANLTGANLNLTDLTNMCAQGTNFSFANLNHSNALSGDFSNANLTGTNTSAVHDFGTSTRRHVVVELCRPFAAGDTRALATE